MSLTCQLTTVPPHVLWGEQRKSKSKVLLGTQGLPSGSPSHFQSNKVPRLTPSHLALSCFLLPCTWCYSLPLDSSLSSWWSKSRPWLALATIPPFFHKDFPTKSRCIIKLSWVRRDTEGGNPLWSSPTMSQALLDRLCSQIWTLNFHFLSTELLLPGYLHALPDWRSQDDKKEKKQGMSIKQRNKT